VGGVRAEWEQQLRTPLDVLNAEQELLNAEVTLTTDRRNVVVASYTLLAALGRLNAQELGVSHLVYDPEQHYREVRNKWFDISITHHDGREEALPPPAPPKARPRTAN
jgi:outer membrane protein